MTMSDSAMEVDLFILGICPRQIYIGSVLERASHFPLTPTVCYILLALFSSGRRGKRD